jgi:hypothetical protein
VIELIIFKVIIYKIEELEFLSVRFLIVVIIDIKIKIHLIPSKNLDRCYSHDPASLYQNIPIQKSPATLCGRALSHTVADLFNSNVFCYRLFSFFFAGQRNFQNAIFILCINFFFVDLFRQGKTAAE